MKPGSTLQRKVSTADISKASGQMYTRITGRTLQKIRERVGDRDGYRCRACGRVAPHYEVDHIVPLHLGGAESDENRQLLCRACHSLKSKKEQGDRDCVA